MREIVIPEDNQVAREARDTAIAPSLVCLSLPLVLRGLFLSIVQFFLKRSILAQKDESFLAAYGGFSAVEGFIFILVFHSLHIISAKAGALHHDKADPKKVGDLYREGLVLGSTLMLPALILSCSAKSIFEYTRQPKIVIDNSHHYFSISMPAYLFDMLYRVQARIGIGVANPAIALIGDGVESIVDVIVTDMLVNGRFGFPEMGVCSAAWGYLAGAIAACIGSTLYLYLKYSSQYQQYALFDFTKKIEWVALKNTITGGLHIACIDIVTNISQMLMTFLCGLEGAGSLVGLQAAGTYSYLVSLPSDGVLEAAAVLIAKYYENSAAQFRQISYQTFLLTTGFSIGSALVLHAATARAAEFFVLSDAAHRHDFAIVKSFLRVQAGMEIVNSVNHASSSLLSGCRETRYPFLLNIACILILNSCLIVAAYFLFHFDSVSTFGVQLAGLVLCAVGACMRWQRYLNQSSLWLQPKLESPRRLPVNAELPQPALLMHVESPHNPLASEEMPTLQPVMPVESPGV